jgi:hypothetical protein
LADADTIFFLDPFVTGLRELFALGEGVDVFGLAAVAGGEHAGFLSQLLKGLAGVLWILIGETENGGGGDEILRKKYFRKKGVHLIYLSTSKPSSSIWICYSAVFSVSSSVRESLLFSSPCSFTSAAGG